MNRMNFGRWKQLGACANQKRRSPSIRNLESRVTKLEALMLDVRERLTRIETRLEQTAINIHKEINSLTWRLVTFVCGFGTTLVVATYFVVHAK